MTATPTRVIEPARYSPSWADRLTAAVAARWRHPFPIYAAAAVVLAVILTASQWLGGQYPVGTISLLHVATGAVGPIWLWLIGTFNAAGARTIDQLRPILRVDDDGEASLRRRLTAMPNGWTIAATVAFALVGLGRLVLDPTMPSRLGYSTDVRSMLALLCVLVVTAVSGIAFVLKLVWSAWQVHLISTHVVRVDLARINLLYGLSGLTGRMAASLILTVTAFYAAETSLISDLYSVMSGLGAIAISAIVFVVPLLGVHDELVAAKGAAMELAATRFYDVTLDLHAATERNDLPVLDPLNKAIGALDVELTRISKIPTWPWQPDTLRWIVGALMFPIILFVAQYVLDRVLR